MKKAKILSILLTMVLLLGTLAACSGGSGTAPAAPAGDAGTEEAGDAAPGESAGGSGDKIKIGFVMKSLSNPFFIVMDDAAKAKAAQLGIELIDLAPEKETDVEKQMQIVENLISQQVDALVLVPAGSKELVPAIKKANDAGIPVIAVDTMPDADALAEAGASVVTFIGSDNYLAGQIAAQELADAIGGEGDVVLIEGISGHESSENRCGGFRDKMAELGITIVASQPANWEQEQGYTVMQNMLQANPNIAGVFGANDLMALGAMKAIEDAGKLGDIVVIGVDATDDGKVSIGEGKMYGTIAQYPDVMAEVALDVCMTVLEGGTVDEIIGTEVGMIGKDDL